MGTRSASFRTSSPDESRQLGRALGRVLPAGSFVAMTGELGSGKTTLIQGVALGLGYAGYVSSPSFVIVNEYCGRVPIHHVDLYRIDGEGQLHDLGYREFYFGGGVTLVEWAEKVPGLLPEERLEILLDIVDETSRDIGVRAWGNEYEAILAEFATTWAGERGS